MIPESILTIYAIILTIASFIIGYYIAKIKAYYHFQSQIPLIRKESLKQSRAVIGGQVSEQIAPYLPGFEFNPSEARFIGKPIDFIIFKGMDNKKIEEIIFVEVKSGNSNLTDLEKQIKKVISEGKVYWHEYRIPKNEELV
jgi:predicted Holliday junction resolvase-like endonuclease